MVPNLELFQLHAVDCRETSHFTHFFPGAFGVEAKEEDDRVMYESAQATITKYHRLKQQKFISQF